jgi:DNA-binding MarR family transcriptional regulator
MKKQRTSNLTSHPEQEVIDALIRVLLKGTSVENTPVDIGHGVLISASELHFLSIVSRFSRENLSQLATRLGVTKGAVSQMSQKLEKKGYVKRYQDEGNKKNICLRLTEWGNDAAAWHDALIDRVSDDLKNEIVKMDTSELHALLKGFSMMEDLLEKSYQIRKIFFTELPEKNADNIKKEQFS